jgi:hypothetical protein
MICCLHIRHRSPLAADPGGACREWSLFAVGLEAVVGPLFELETEWSHAAVDA